MKPLKLPDGDKKDLVAFLKALDGEGWQKVTPPATFPNSTVTLLAGLQNRTPPSKTLC